MTSDELYTTAELILEPFAKALHESPDLQVMVLQVESTNPGPLIMIEVSPKGLVHIGHGWTLTSQSIKQGIELFVSEPGIVADIELLRRKGQHVLVAGDSEDNYMTCGLRSFKLSDAPDA